MDTRKMNARPTDDRTEGMENTSHLDIDGESVAVYVDTDMAEELAKRWNAYPDLIATLEALELRCTQARIASGIGKPRLKDADFLRGECERMAKDARAAIAKATGETL